MPTYDYECSACGHRFELFEKPDQKSVKPCAKCGKKKAHRLLSAGAGVIFKGSGFYVTDYKRSGASPTESKPSSDSKKAKEKKD